MEKLEENILQFGQKRDLSGLTNLIDKCSLEQLNNLVEFRLSQSTFTFTWDYLLSGLNESTSGHEKRLAITLTLLEQLEIIDLPQTKCNSFIQKLCIYLNKFHSHDLVRLCAFCMECIQSPGVKHMKWKDLLPEVLNVLQERNTFTVDDVEYTGASYKTEFINTICSASWNPTNALSLLAVFIEMPLTKEEHLKVVQKLVQHLEKITIQEIPMFTYQLLKLCQHQNGRIVFMKLQQYFLVRIYKDAVLSDSESPRLDDIDSCNDQEYIEAEGTVLFHINNAASLGNHSIKDYLTSFKSLVKAPEAILNPFQLMCLLSISAVAQFEDTVFEIIRQSVVRSFQEEQKRCSSLWYKEMVANIVNVDTLFKQVISFSLQNDRFLVLQGLVNFAFCLMNVGMGLGRDIVVEKQWSLGTMILLKMIKKRQIAPSIIQTICNKIVTGQSVTHYIECIYTLSKNLPLYMLENQSCIVELMEGVVQIPGSNAIQLLDAIIPLAKISPTIRDHLILLLRKSLYSRSSATRQTAVRGFLKLLTSLKLSNMIVLSQSSTSSGSFCSNRSLFTQVSINMTSQSMSSAFSNEALCLELLSILKRCFMQQVEVKIHLYEGLHEAFYLNSELGIPVLDVFLLHLSEFYVITEENLPLDFKRVVLLREVDAVLQEPLGKLLYAVGLITAKLIEREEDNASVVKSKNMLEQLCEKMANCELVDFEMDDGTDLTDLLPECQAKVLVLKEAMSVYEALIGYKMCSWFEDSERQGQDLNALYQAYNRLIHFSKSLGKSKKLSEKKNKNANTSSQLTGTIKKSNSGKNFVMPDTLLNFHCLSKGLSLLLLPEVPWTTTSRANVVKCKREVHRHFLSAALFQTQKIKNLKSIIDSSEASNIYKEFVTIGVVIYKNITKKAEDYADFDCTSTVLGLEVFHSMLQVVSIHFKSHYIDFLYAIEKRDKNSSEVAAYSEILSTYEKIFEIEDESLSDDPEFKKISLVVINTLSLLSTHISSQISSVGLQLYDWAKTTAENCTMPCKKATPFISLLMECHLRHKVTFTLIETVLNSITEILGTLSDESSVAGTRDKQSFVDEGTVTNILLALCGFLKSALDDVDCAILRLKSLHSALNYPGQDQIDKKLETLKSNERSVSCQLCLLVGILTQICNLNIQPGPLSEAIFKNVTQLYSTLSNFTKHFTQRSSKVNLAFQPARFERLVKLAGKQLAPTVYPLILHIEENQKQQNNENNTQAKRKNVDSNTLKSKVLKETRLIPKVVFEIEQFSKCVIQLSNKTKVDLARFVGQGTVRDFRILQLKEVLEKAGGVQPATQASQIDTSNSSIPEESEQEKSIIVDSDDTDTTPPPTKKSRDSIVV